MIILCILLTTSDKYSLIAVKYFNIVLKIAQVFFSISYTFYFTSLTAFTSYSCICFKSILITVMGNHFHSSLLPILGIVLTTKTFKNIFYKNMQNKSKNCTYKILCKTILFTKQMAQCDCTANEHAQSKHVQGTSFHKTLNDSSQTVTDISGKIHN